MADHPCIVINGQAGTLVSALDRGLSYGDGVFRTVRIEASQPKWWTDHLEKLGEDCRRLGLVAPDAQIWGADLATLGALPEWGVLRLTVTRGEGMRGYGAPKPQRCTRILSCWNTDLSPLPEQGLTLRVCDLRLGHQPVLAGVKHLNRLENVMARMEWTDPAIHEAVLLDTKGCVVSGVMSNLFIWRDQCLQTPRLDFCGVAGVTRKRLMALATAQGIQVQEVELTLSELLEASEIMLSNSLIGLRRVARLGERVWPDPVISPRLAALLDA